MSAARRSFSAYSHDQINRSIVRVCVFGLNLFWFGLRFSTTCVFGLNISLFYFRFQKVLGGKRGKQKFPKTKKEMKTTLARQKNPVYLIGLPNIIRPPPRCQRLNCPKFNEEKTETRLSTTFNYRESFALSRSNE